MTTTDVLAHGVDLDTRARRSLGSSSTAIYRMVGRACAAYHAGGTLVDVGCGSGGLWREVGSRFSRYCGLDAVRYEGFPANGQFQRLDLDADCWPALECQGDVVVAVETIEHLENPWAFMKKLAALARPGALVIVTTPNQLSVLSLLTLITKRRFSAFQDAQFPTHKTALLESDLQRIAGEAALDPIQTGYSHEGRVPLGAWHYPEAAARMWPRLLSDNVMLVARKRDV